jgi:hypothetical protein
MIERGTSHDAKSICGLLYYISRYVGAGELRVGILELRGLGFELKFRNLKFEIGDSDVKGFARSPRVAANFSNVCHSKFIFRKFNIFKIMFFS